MITETFPNNKKYHSDNAWRDYPQFANPSLVRFIKPKDGNARVVIEGGRQNPPLESVVIIDVSDEKEVVKTWKNWCLKNEFPMQYTNYGIEIIVEFLVDSEVHPYWCFDDDCLTEEALAWKYR